MSNQKQIALGFLQYIQDYDEKFPLGIGYAEPDTTVAHDSPPSPKPPPGFTQEPSAKKKTYAQSWGPDRKLPDGRTVPGLLSPYVKSNQLFMDPKAPRTKAGDFAPDYIYNDLLVSKKQGEIINPSQTVLITNSERRFANVGHALSLDAPPADARFNNVGGCDAGKGAAVGRKARFRHIKGANFAFTDGHVKWFKAGADDRIFFPPRESSSVSAIDPVTKRQTAPIPGKSMAFGGRVYDGTFHLR